MLISSVKVSFFIGAVFLSVGIYLPFFPLWLKERHFSADHIALLLSIPLIVKVIFTPFAMAYAGRMPQRRQAAQLFCGLSLLSFTALIFVNGFWPTLLILGLFGLFWGALIPLGDSFALSEMRQKGSNYGMIRLWGSAAFVVANLGAGRVLDYFGIGEVPVLIIVMLAIALVTPFLLPCYGLPVDERPRTGPALSGDLAIFFKNYRFMLMSISAGLLQSSHAMIYSFGTIDWLRRGYLANEVGFFWAAGVVAEIVLFMQAARLLKTMSAQHLLMVGGVAAILRWLIHGHIEGVFPILMLQCLHGLSFGATYLGMQAFIAREVSEVETPAAQGVMVFVSGMTVAVLTGLCGFLYSQFSTGGFYAMALISLAGLAPLILLHRRARLAPQDGGGGIEQAALAFQAVFMVFRQ